LFENLSVVFLYYKKSVKNVFEVKAAENDDEHCFHKGLPVNRVKVLEDDDFKYIKELCENHAGWNLAYDKRMVKVWTKAAKATLSDVPASVAYDVLHDPYYRSSWDKYHVAAKDIGIINPNNDVCYYAGMCFILVRSRSR
uniref:START domain-containing protein n=1 Tax=Gongylonema pulchrum TaxID=637853 RepID=A0A183DBE9_9BILA